MKKALALLFMCGLLTACSTTTIDRTHLYGEVKRVYLQKGCYHAEVWCNSKQKFYTIVTNDWEHQVGDVVLIK